MDLLLKQITFTGVDERTDLERLQKLQKKYPLAEFGVLISKNWSTNGNRYMDPDNFSKLKGMGLNLSLHVCGALAGEAIKNDFSNIRSLVDLSMFNRSQLNVATKKPVAETKNLVVPHELNEIIIQQKNIEYLDIYRTIENPTGFSVLLDASGGNGIDTGINVVNSDEFSKVGYAGGMNPENVGQKLRILLNQSSKPFWIDMESGVRTNDWFDLDKVEMVLEICYEILGE